MRIGIKPKVAWVEGKVNRRGEHCSIHYGEAQRPVALVAPHKRHKFTVQFMIKPRRNDQRNDRILDMVRHELRFYLLDAIGSDAWPFVQYHCDSPANRRSIVHWSWHPARLPR